MITRKEGFQHNWDPDAWLGRSGKAGYYPTQRQFKQIGGNPPKGALATGGGLRLFPVKPRLMMDPSDPSTWQRHYVFPR